MSCLSLTQYILDKYMKLSYFPDTDRLYIDISDCPLDRLRQRPSVESEVVNENLIIALDSNCHLSALP
ncbi:MAG: DUF2283 domain-containing protein [Leptolyngbyaceae cyanobacterium]